MEVIAGVSVPVSPAADNVPNRPSGQVASEGTVSLAQDDGVIGGLAHALARTMATVNVRPSGCGAFDGDGIMIGATAS